MPNYVMNVVTIRGNQPQIECANVVCCDMDFNKMIPMPETLNVTSGSTTSQALGAYVASQESSTLHRYGTTCWFEVPCS